MSTIPPIYQQNGDVNNSTNIPTKRTTPSHLKPLNTKKTMTYDVGTPGPGLGQTQKCGGGSPLNGAYSR